ncbi:hypothetical protein NDU88_004909 [Pleurodeles waltl]|uniref:Uncharacterized protein n=1 Tax=Pleurodeles waltl TaxID=8319 RepID=A0AAV7QJ86_PLEWA|nr:hypothetical protein NDU88_004909 [Pleurodeles waltl]
MGRAYVMRNPCEGRKSERSEERVVTEMREHENEDGGRQKAERSEEGKGRKVASRGREVSERQDPATGKGES